MPTWHLGGYPRRRHRVMRFPVIALIPGFLQEVAVLQHQLCRNPQPLQLTIELCLFEVAVAWQGLSVTS